MSFLKTNVKQVLSDTNAFETIGEIMRRAGVKSYKGLDSGVAIRKGGMWRYFELAFDGRYHYTGSTEKLVK